MARPRNFRLDTRKGTAQGLVGLWGPGPTGSGTLGDVSAGRINDATWNGTGTHWVADDERQGIVGQYNGSDDYGNVPSTPPLRMGTGNLSVSAWIRITSSTNTYQGVLVKSQGSRDYVLAVNAGAMDRVYIQGISESLEVTMSVTLVVNTWYHIVAVREAVNAVVYVDGVSVNSSARIITPTDGTDALEIGTGNGGFGWFTGQIDDARVYNRALSAAEGNHIFVKTKPNPYSDIAMRPRRVVKPAAVVGGMLQRFGSMGGGMDQNLVAPGMTGGMRA